MTMRTWLILVGILIMGGLNGFLISKEYFEKMVVEESDVEYDDRLGDLVYSKGNRESNLAAFGLSEDQIATSKNYFRQYEKMEKQIGARLKKSEGDLTDVFCSRKEDIRPRYAAMRYLILQENSERVVWDPKKNNSFDSQNWSAVISFETLYEDIEKSRTQLPASTVMVVIAMVSQNEDLVISRQEPWGRSGSSWNWEEVQSQYSKYVKRSIQYLSMMLYITEVANGENGICQ